MMFWNRARRIREVLLTATRADSTVYSLVAFEDGSLGIARDQVPLDSFQWSNSDMDDCMETFLRLSGLEALDRRLSDARN
jgi:hypothetical protein